ncbi:hypothetical protein XENTR_v10004532 [Xenopus tropicalis]|nr:hypothetical protein XENTR_v10004532 [Xenopus tropicalis]
MKKDISTGARGPAAAGRVYRHTAISGSILPSAGHLWLLPAAPPLSLSPTPLRAFAHTPPPLAALSAASCPEPTSAVPLGRSLVGLGSETPSLHHSACTPAWRAVSAVTTCLPLPWGKSRRF